MTSIKDIAREAGVSVTTVSLVLNNKGNISEDTRKRVLQVVKDLNYTRNTQARNLRNRETRVIGYAQPLRINHENIILSRFLQKISEKMEESDRYVLVFNERSDGDLDIYQHLIDSQRVDGFILSFTRQLDERFSFFKQQGIPFVAFGRSLTPLDDEAYWVDVDNVQGMYDLTSHLIEFGHRRIGLIGWLEGSWVNDLRIKGYRMALEDAGIPYDPQLVMQAEDMAEEGYENTRRLLESVNPPTAICGLSDILGAGALHYVQANHCRVAVTGYDDNPISRLTMPTLTTVRQPITEVAQRIFELMIAQLENREIEQSSYLLAPKVIIRESSDFRLD